jgi:hypothetical protein
VCEREREREREGGRGRERGREREQCCFFSYLGFTQYILDNRKMKLLTVFEEENSE